jgi:hypothetical protein
MPRITSQPRLSPSGHPRQFHARELFFAVVSALWALAVRSQPLPPALVDLRFDGLLTANWGTLASSTTITPSGGASLTADRFGRANRSLHLPDGNFLLSNNLSLPSGNASRSLCSWFRPTLGSGGGFQSIGEWGARAAAQRFGILLSGGDLFIVGQWLDYRCTLTPKRELSRAATCTSEHNL